MGKPTIYICENKGADQLRGNRKADQRLCFRYSDSTFPPLLNSKISSFYLFSVLVQVGLCLTCSETILLVFPRGGSFVNLLVVFKFYQGFEVGLTQLYLYSPGFWLKKALTNTLQKQVVLHMSRLVGKPTM